MSALGGSESPTASLGGGEPLKRRRITESCDRCHRSGVKCSTSADPDICGPCAAFGSECTYLRPIRRRGPVPRAGAPRASSIKGESSTGNHVDNWVYEPVTTPEVLETLAESYYRIIYPILPYFHWPSFMSKIRAGVYMSDRAFCATTMAMCAITSARVRDGAGGSEASRDALPPSTASSETFYDACLRCFPSDLSPDAAHFDYKRARVLLAMLCIQYGQVRQLTTHLHEYYKLCAMDGFQNETRWPPDLPETEIQERRRLFWGAYTIDVYSSTTWGGVVRHRESQCTVLYPANVEDDSEITEHGIVRRDPGRVSWLIGWSFTTDLYRILEHALEQLRHRRTDHEDRVTTMFNSRSGPTPAEVLQLVNDLYAELPAEFKGAQAMSGNVGDDRYGFQAADIIVTMQTVKMVMTSLEDAGVEKRCAIAGELLDALSLVPTAYIQAISSPILHHLAGVGHLLGSVIQSPLSHWSYLQVRNVLLAMVELLSSLESTLSFVPGIAEKLRDHVSRIDQYMTTAALDRSRRAQVYHNALPASAWTSSSAARPARNQPPLVTAEVQLHTTSPEVPVHASPSTGSATWSTPNIQQPQLLSTDENGDDADLAAAGLVSDLLKAHPPVAVSTDAEYTLPTDLLSFWPFDMGETFDMFAHSGAQ